MRMRRAFVGLMALLALTAMSCALPSRPATQFPTPVQPTTVPTALRAVVDSIQLVLAGSRKTCAVRPAPWLFPGADSGSIIRCAEDELRLYHYPNQDSQEWGTVARDFTPAGPRGYAANGYVLINYFPDHHLDEQIYAALDRA